MTAHAAQPKAPREVHEGEGVMLFYVLVVAAACPTRTTSRDVQTTIRLIFNKVE